MSHRLDVIVPTFNRPDLLARTLKSLERATRPDGVDIGIIVVDNNSSPPQAARNAELVAGTTSMRCELVNEPQQGSSYARNAGIAASNAEWIGFIDDDEQIDASWFVVVSRELTQPHVGFISGPCLPDWESAPPAWLPAGIGRYIAVIGWVELTDRIKEFNREIDAMAMGGNMAVKHNWLEAVGPYNTGLGRIRGRLLSAEDHDMHERLIAAGARGFYVPDLIIHHFVPTSRMTKRYHRRWAFWHGFSMHHLERTRPRDWAMLFGIPRYLYGNLVRSAPRLVSGIFARGGQPAESFALELDAIELLGRLYAKIGPSPAATASGPRGASTVTGHAGIDAGRS